MDEKPIEVSMCQLCAINTICFALLLESHVEYPSPTAFSVLFSTLDLWIGYDKTCLIERHSKCVVWFFKKPT